MARGGELDIQVNIDKALAKLGRLPDAYRDALKSEIDDLATEMRDRAKTLAGTLFHVRSGTFQRSIKKSVRVTKTGVIGKVYSNDPVAHLLEKGVRPHDITAKNGKVLAIMSGTVFAKVVHHPGFRGHTIINAAFQEMQDQVRDGIEATVADVSAKANVGGDS